MQSCCTTYSPQPMLSMDEDGPGDAAADVAKETLSLGLTLLCHTLHFAVEVGVDSQAAGHIAVAWQIRRGIRAYHMCALCMFCRAAGRRQAKSRQIGQRNLLTAMSAKRQGYQPCRRT